MSKPKEIWWSYVKNMVKDYPEGPEKTRTAVEAAIEEYADRPEQLQLMDLVYWKKIYNLSEAAEANHIPFATAKLWHKEFIRCVAKHYGLTD